LFARWASFAVGLWLLLAPLVLGYDRVGPILHDVMLGYLACMATLAALEWPQGRLGLAVLGAWLLVAGRVISPGVPGAVATELAAGVALLALALVPGARSARRPMAPPAKSTA
jgi:hypothetical protein